MIGQCLSIKSLPFRISQRLGSDVMESETRSLPDSAHFTCTRFHIALNPAMYRVTDTALDEVFLKMNTEPQAHGWSTSQDPRGLL